MTRAVANTRGLAALLAIAVLVAAPAALAQAPQPAAPPAAPAVPALPHVIYRLEMLRVGAQPADFVAKLQPLHSLEEVEKLLKASEIPFSWRRQDLDSATAAAQLVQNLESLPPNEVFAMPQPDGGLVIGAIVSRRTP